MPRSPVLRIIYTHPDKDLVQRILTEIVEDYKKGRVQANDKQDASFDELMRQTATLKKELDEAELELRKAKNDANVTDLDETSEIQQPDDHADSPSRSCRSAGEMAMHQHALKKLQGLPGATNSVASVSSTNAPGGHEPERIDGRPD